MFHHGPHTLRGCALGAAEVLAVKTSPYWCPRRRTPIEGVPDHLLLLALENLAVVLREPDLLARMCERYGLNRPQDATAEQLRDYYNYCTQP